MSKHVLIWIALAFLPTLALADNIPERFTIQPDPDFRSLEEKVKSLKKDVIDISQDLSRLQDELLTPATTKVNIFLSLEGPQGFVLDSAQFLLDNRPVANYLYTSREQDALQHGGVHRLFLGNVAVGPHQFTASFAGKDASGKLTTGKVTGNFEKDLTAKYLEIKINPANKDQMMAVKEY